MSNGKFETVRSLVTALNEREVDGYLACCTEDLELVSPTVAIEGGYTGRTGIERFFADLRDTAADFQVEIERLEDVGHNVLAFGTWRASGRASEVAGDIAIATVYEFRGQKIRRIQVFLSRKEALKAVGLPE